jgi:hypothetical protein
MTRATLDLMTSIIKSTLAGEEERLEDGAIVGHVLKEVSS